MQEKIYSKEVFDLNLKLESLTYFINVPIIALFLILANQIYEDKFLLLLIALVSAIIITLVCSVLTRTIIFNKIIYAEPTSENKFKFFNLPVYAGIIVNLQWLIGFIIVFVIYTFLVEYSHKLVISFIYAFFIQFVNNFASHASIGDQFVSKIIFSEKWKEIEIKGIKSPFSLKGRILLTNFGFSILAISTIFYLFVNGNFSNQNDPYKDYIIYAIFFQTFLVVLFGSLNNSDSILKNVTNLKIGFEEFKNGNLKSTISIIDNEELGLMVGDFKLVQEKIAETLQKTNQTILKLNQVSSNLSNNSNSIFIESSNLNKLSETMSVSMNQFYSSIENSRNSSIEQVELTKKSFESLNLLNGEITNNSKSVEDSKKISTKSSLISSEGSKLGKELESSISEIKSESDQIKEYSTVIAEISEKVGLLSLNASIEAARAGEFGRGFAVVAGEISKLGESTTENSGLIDKKIKELSKSVLKGVEKIKILSENFKNIEEASNMTNESLLQITKNLSKELNLKDKVKQNMEELVQNSDNILNSSNEQKKVIEEFNINTSKIKKASENLYNSTSELQNISKELKLDADDLVKQIQFFKF